MGLYDDGGVKFAEEKFADSRAYNEKQAKKQDKFAKYLLGAKTLVSGYSELIDQRAADADKNLMYQKASYKTVINANDKIRTQHELNKEKGISNAKYLETNLYNEIIAEAEKDYSKADLDYLKPAFRKHAKELVTAGKNNLLTTYNNMIEASYAAPNFGENGEEYNEWFESNSKAPRSIADVIRNKASKLLKTNNKETLEYKKTEESKEFDPDKDAFAKYDTVQSAIKSYHAATEKGFDLVEIIDQAVKDGEYIGKVVKILNPISEDFIDVKAGTKTTKTTQSFIRENVSNIIPEGETEAPLYVTDTYKLTDVVSDIAATALSMTEIQSIKKLVVPGSITAKGLDDILKNNPTINDGNKAMVYINDNVNDLVIDFKDEKAFIEGFDTIYSSFIQMKRHPNPSKKNVSLAIYDSNTKLYKMNPDYEDVIKQEGWDKASVIQQYRDSGATNILKGSNTIDEDDGTSITLSPVTDLFKDDKEAIDIYNTIISPTGTAFDTAGLDLGRKIESAEAAGQKYVPIGKQDIGIMFEIKSLEGTVIDLYWDIENNTFQQGK